MASTTFAAIDKPRHAKRSGSSSRGLLSDFGIQVESSALHEGMGRMVERFDNMVARVVGPAPLPQRWPCRSSIRCGTRRETKRSMQRLPPRTRSKAEYENLPTAR